MRSSIGSSGSPKYPMPRVVVHTIVSATTNAAAAANTGRQRAASQSNRGNSRAIGTTVANDACGRKITSVIVSVIATSATATSRISFGDGGSRAAAAAPISSGATVRIPSASDANQCCQIVKLDAVGKWNNLNPTT